MSWIQQRAGVERSGSTYVELKVPTRDRNRWKRLLCREVVSISRRRTSVVEMEPRDGESERETPVLFGPFYMVWYGLVNVNLYSAIVRKSLSTENAIARESQAFRRCLKDS